MIAVVKTGGKQYKVKANDYISVEKIPGALGSTVTLDKVLMIMGGQQQSASFIGTPFVKDAKVVAEIIDQFRDDKVIVFKKKRRKNYRRKNGHRQSLTKIRIKDIIKQ